MKPSGGSRLTPVASGTQRRVNLPTDEARNGPSRSQSRRNSNRQKTLLHEVTGFQTLTDIGIIRRQSSNWQRLADLELEFSSNSV